MFSVCFLNRVYVAQTGLELLVSAFQVVGITGALYYAWFIDF
jgi:hypothetical protein